MAFIITVTVPTRDEPIFQYQWATSPSDGQIEDAVEEAKLFRYSDRVVKGIRACRDQFAVVGINYDDGMKLQLTK